VIYALVAVEASFPEALVAILVVLKVVLVVELALVLKYRKNKLIKNQQIFEGKRKIKKSNFREQAKVYSRVITFQNCPWPCGTWGVPQILPS